jgi:hypothetical protein
MVLQKTPHFGYWRLRSNLLKKQLFLTENGCRFSSWFTFLSQSTQAYNLTSTVCAVMLLLPMSEFPSSLTRHFVIFLSPSRCMVSQFLKTPWYISKRIILPFLIDLSKVLEKTVQWSDKIPWKLVNCFKKWHWWKGAYRDIHMHRDRKMHIYFAVITELITSCFFVGPFSTAVSATEVICVRIWKDAIK